MGPIFASCSCRNPSTGQRWPVGECPSWSARGHKRWGWSADLPRVSGQRRQIRRSGYLTRKEAQAALAAETHQIMTGTAPSLEARQVTLSQWWEQWLQHADLRPSSKAAYQAASVHILPGLGRYRLAEIQPAMVRELLRLTGQGKTGRKRPLSAASVGQVKSVLSSCLSAALRDDLITRNPCHGVRPPRVERTKVPRWSTGERDRFLRVVAEREPGLHAAYSIAAFTGMRRGEVLALRWCNVSLDEGWLDVAENAAEISGKVIVGRPKSRRSVRRVFFGEKLTAILRSHRKEQATARLAAPDWGSDLVFTDAAGQMIKPWLFTMTFAKLASEAKLGGSLHILRHTSVSVDLAAGISPVVVAAKHGHDIGTMLKVYADAIPSELAAAAVVSERFEDAR